MTHAIRQEEKIHLSVTNIWTSLPNETIASTDQSFEVYARVENEMIDVTDPDWKAVAENVTAKLQATGHLDIYEETQASPVFLGGGDAVTLTWWVTCTGPADVVLEVSPDGIDENTNEPVIKPDNIEKLTQDITQERKAHLQMEILEPDYGDTFSSDQEFEMRAEVCNVGEAVALDVQVFLLPLVGEAEVVQGAFTTTIESIGGGACDVVTWTLKCSGSEQVHLKVVPAGTDENTLEAIPVDPFYDTDNIILNQENKALLEANILTPMDGETFTVGETFQVKATVENTGQAVALDAEVELIIEGDAEPISGITPIPPSDLGDMEESEMYTLTWDLQCTASGPVTFTVRPSGTDENTGEDCAVEPARVVVEQQTETHLVATVTAESDTFSTEQEYMVTANIANTGGADADDVYAVITVEGAAELASGEDFTQTIGFLEGEDAIDVQWLLVCTGSGPVTVTVEPAGMEINRGVAAPADGDTIVLNQVAKAHLMTQVSAPDKVAVGSEFVVHATITNTGTAAAEDVYATLQVTEGAELTESAEKMVSSSLAHNESGEVTWTLVCTGPRDVVITVSPRGNDENTGESIPQDNLEDDGVVVEQEVRMYLPIIQKGF
jgi:hypothetical protein